MKKYLITKIKSASGSKTDLLAIVEDGSNILNEKLGFSIKSHVGGAPTLVNASSQTNFLFEVSGFMGDIDAVNSIEGSTKIRDRIKAIYDSGGRFNFIKVSSETFNSNLRFTDTLFPKILAQMLLCFYSGDGNDLMALAAQVSKKRIIDANEDEIIYKLKGFLRSSALGMVPSVTWDTNLSAYGGYIVVLNDGQLICYSLLKDDDFKDYLFKNTKFDTPSTTRHKFGKLFYEDGKLYMNLNLQIRFKK